MMIDVNLS